MEEISLALDFDYNDERNTLARDKQRHPNCPVKTAWLWFFDQLYRQVFEKKGECFDYKVCNQGVIGCNHV